MINEIQTNLFIAILRMITQRDKLLRYTEWWSLRGCDALCRCATLRRRKVVPSTLRVTSQKTWILNYSAVSTSYLATRHVNALP